MIASKLLVDVTNIQKPVDKIAQRQLARIDIEGLRLGTGEHVKLKLTPPPPNGDCITLVGDDPPPAKGIFTSLPLRARRDERFCIEVSDPDPLTRDIWHGAKIIEVYETNRWIDYLPAVFREDHAQAEFLSRLLGSLFVEGERIELQLDHVGDLITPSRLPSLAAARFLARCFDIDVDLMLPKPDGDKDKADRRALELARRLLARLLPHALDGGTAQSVLTWIDAVAQTRGMSPERRRRIAVIEGFKMRQLFTLSAPYRTPGLEPTDVRVDWGWLANSAPLANDPMAHRAFLDRSTLADTPTLGLPNESDDDMLLARLFAGRLWLFVPRRIGDEPTPEQWKQLLAPILPAHLRIDVIDTEMPFHLGYGTVLGTSTNLPPPLIGSLRLGHDSLLPTKPIQGSSMS